MKKINVPETISLEFVNGSGIKESKEHLFKDFLETALDNHKELLKGFKGYKKAREIEKLMDDIKPGTPWIIDNEIYNTIYTAVDELEWRAEFQRKAKTYFEALMNVESYKPPKEEKSNDKTK